jgi:hypothetical protein
MSCLSQLFEGNRFDQTIRLALEFKGEDRGDLRLSGLQGTDHLRPREAVSQHPSETDLQGYAKKRGLVLMAESKHDPNREKHGDS